MKKRILAALIALLMAFAVMPVINADNAQIEPYWTVPEGYCVDDYNAIAAFLEQEDENGVKNGEWFSPYYDVNDPTTWWLYSEWGDGFMILWTGDYGIFPPSADGLKHVAYVTLPSANYTLQIPNYTGMVGSLDLSCCNELYGVNVSYTRVSELLLPPVALETVCITGSLVSSIDLSVCPAIWDFDADEFAGTYAPVSYDHPEMSFESTDFSVCPGLHLIECEHSNISTINLTGLTQLESLQIAQNLLSEIDVSDCSNLNQLIVSYNELTELDVTHNEQLSFLNCLNNDLTSLDVSSCHELANLFCSGNDLRYIDLFSCPNIPIGMIGADGPGYVGCWYGYNGYYHQLNAEPEEGASFDGWYLLREGEWIFVSCDPDYDFDLNADPNAMYIARFSSGSSLPGDVDMDGEVSVADALLALRSAMGVAELNAEQLTAGDMNGDGTVSVDDSLIILRTAMGLI